MPCYHPLTLYKSRDLLSGTNIDRSLTTDSAKGIPSSAVLVPCGQCIGCRISHARMWALRAQHEAHCHLYNWFVTLTYDNEKLANDQMNRSITLNRVDFPSFVRELRRRLKTPIRYLHCGEYGETTFRPHHHAILFGPELPDLYVWYTQPYKYYRSPLVESCWPWGNVLIAGATPETMLYTAKYVLKAVKGDAANDYYRGRMPPHLTMSRRPGLGQKFFLKYHSDFLNHDKFITERGLTIKTPRYYDNLADTINPYRQEEIRDSRRLAAIAADVAPADRQRAERYTYAVAATFSKPRDPNLIGE